MLVLLKTFVLHLNGSFLISGSFSHYYSSDRSWLEKSRDVWKLKVMTSPFSRLNPFSCNMGSTQNEFFS